MNDLECHFLFGKDRLSMAYTPSDFPKWQLVYYYYRKQAALLDFDLLLEKLRGHIHVKQGQNIEPNLNRL